MATTQSNPSCDAIQQVYDQFSGVLRQQSEHIEELGQRIKQLQGEQERLQEAASHLLEPLEHSLTGGVGTKAPSPSDMLACMRKLAAATSAGQVFELLTGEAARMDVRTAVFDVRGRAAWGYSAGGFGPELTMENLRTLVVPLNHNGPFRQAFETIGTVETNAAGLEHNRNVLSRLTPAESTRILLIPVRSAGYVAAVLYAEIGEKRDTTLVDALKVLAEFAGAQMDRLMVLNGAIEGVEAAPATEKSEKASEETAAGETEPAAFETTVVAEIPPEVPSSAAVPAGQEVVVPEKGQVSAVPAETSQPADEPPAAAQAAEIAHPAEEEEKIHRDARRFSKLLVSEIELYNKNSVDEGRRSKDLYLRLKKDIDRSRETYEKRFARTVANQFDYFHEELVRTLAGNDPSLLGSGYPGPSV